MVQIAGFTKIFLSYSLEITCSIDGVVDTSLSRSRNRNPVLVIMSDVGFHLNWVFNEVAPAISVAGFDRNENQNGFPVSNIFFKMDLLSS